MRLDRGLTSDWLRIMISLSFISLRYKLKKNEIFINLGHPCYWRMNLYVLIMELFAPRTKSIDICGKILNTLDSKCLVFSTLKSIVVCTPA